MITKELVDRINTLAHKQRECGLDEIEKKRAILVAPTVFGLYQGASPGTTGCDPDA